VGLPTSRPVRSLSGSPRRGATARPPWCWCKTTRGGDLQRLRADGEADAAQRRHAEHLADVAEQAYEELRGPEQALWLGRLEDDVANFDAGLAWARDARASDLLLRIAGALWRFWFVRGHIREGRSWIGLIDTNQPEGQMPAFDFGHVYAMTGRSLVVFGLATESIATRRLRQGLGALLDVVEAPLPG